MSESIYEVLAQDTADGEVALVGSVRAPDAGLALTFAREIFYRRGRCERIGVVPREAVCWSDEAELTERNRDRAYRTPAFFVRARRDRAAEIPG
ncbi:MAG: Phenylacetic acid degradation [Candidatus Eremiobacteraeota bacterium]|nr:Phenylacetic acid degradation [Candidatus Eremiobacteraeota bacterium]